MRPSIEVNSHKVSPIRKFGNFVKSELYLWIGNFNIRSEPLSRARILGTRVAASSGMLWITYFGQGHAASVRNASLNAPTRAEPQG